MRVKPEYKLVIIDEGENENEHMEKCQECNEETTIISIMNNEKERKKQLQKECYQKNKKEISEKYQKNAEKLIEYQTMYNYANHDKYLDYQKKYYEKRREKLLNEKKEMVTCECGKMVTQGHLNAHRKTNIHQKYLSKKLNA